VRRFQGLRHAFHATVKKAERQQGCSIAQIADTKMRFKHLRRKS
jgi:hypothetical protein